MSASTILQAIRLAIPIGLLLGLLWFRHEAHSYHAAFDQLKAEYIADSQAAAVRQIQANLAQEARWKAKAEETDRDYQNDLQGALRAAAAYSATHACGVRPTAERSPGATDSVPVASGAESDQRSGAASVMVAVTAEDVDICTENTARLKAAHDWAVSR